MGKKLLWGIMAVIFTISFAMPASAQVTLDDVLKRVEALERENASLKSEVMALKAAPAPAPMASTAAATGNFLKTKPEVELYGFLKMDAYYSDSQQGATGVSALDAVSYAPRETSGINQASFNGSAQDTRLGMNFKAPDLDNGGKVTGKLEMDFGGGQPSTTYTPRLRLAYTTLDFANWSVTAGQAWDFVAPLNANLMNPGALYRQGNLGYRHPQAYVTNKWGAVPGGKLTTKVGFIDSDDSSQENSGAPVAAAYAAYDTKLFGKAFQLGVGGLFGTNSTSFLNTKETNNNNIYATTVGMTLTLADWLSVKAEGFSGAKLDDFNAGMSTINGVTTTVAADSKALRSQGGFAEITYKPIKVLETNYGIGVDYGNADQTILAASKTSLWKSNKTAYTNLKYSLSKDVLVGLEYQYMVTNYMDGAKGDDNRIQSSLIYKF